jgi:hypothetical protein
MRTDLQRLKTLQIPPTQKTLAARVDNSQYLESTDRPSVAPVASESYAGITLEPVMVKSGHSDLLHERSEGSAGPPTASHRICLTERLGNTVGASFEDCTYSAYEGIPVLSDQTALA